MGSKTKLDVKKKRIYQVAKEFHISNEALIDFLQDHKFKVRNHMAPLTNDMYSLVEERFGIKEDEVEKESDIRKKIQEKKNKEEARKQAIRQEIDEILELSKTDIYKEDKKVKSRLLKRELKRKIFQPKLNRKKL